MKKSIGGFFEKENLTGNYNSFHSSDAIKVVNGRSALFILLMKIMPSKVRLPFYSCDSLLQPILKLDIPFEYYSIDKNFMPIADAFEKDDLVIFINYFGLLENRIIAFTAQNDIQHFLVDNTQSFFIKPKNYYAFNSARKFFGVTDGAFLFPNNLKFENDLESISFSEEFLNLRSQGDLENGYSLYQFCSINCNCIDYILANCHVAHKRKTHCRTYHRFFKQHDP